MRTLEQFLAKVDKSETCWLWTGAKGRGGYGNLVWNGRHTNAHRVSYELHVGPIPDPCSIDHLCSVRHCVNPAHLEPVTVRENLRRGAGFPGVNARKTHCPRGHAYDAENTYVWNGLRYCRTCRRAPFRKAA